MEDGRGKVEIVRAISEAIVALEKVHHRISTINEPEDNNAEESMSWKLEKMIHSLSLLMIMHLKVSDGSEAL